MVWLPLLHCSLQRRAVEFDEMRDTVNYDLIVVMDGYDRAEVVREVRLAGVACRALAQLMEAVVQEHGWLGRGRPTQGIRSCFQGSA